MNAEIADEFASYEEQIKKYCRGQMDETRVQKYRLPLWHLRSAPGRRADATHQDSGAAS